MKGQKVTIELLNDKIQNTFPNWDYEIINFEKATSPWQIKCLHCQRISAYKNIYAFLYKQSPCSCNSLSSQYKSIQNKQKLLDYLQENPQFTLIDWTQANDDKKRPAAKFLCNSCNNIFIRRTYTFLKDPKCPFCDYASKKNTINRNKWLNERGYELLSEYKDNKTPVEIRHLKCGFIWTTKIDRLTKFDGTCPQCNRFMSKGEQKISKYLYSHNIEFEREKSFSWQSHSRVRYDFWIPKWNLIIEYNGRQHYEETNFFSSSLQENQERDKLKMTEALENEKNYLIIPDTFYNNIEEILNNWFNDYSNMEVKGKLMTFERSGILKKDENIV